MKSDPFRDEVAIDFPSMRPCIERAREGLLSSTERERADTCKVAVQISEFQAYRGTVVSATVPVRATCAPCGGRGEVWSDTCRACGGSGSATERALLRVHVPPRVSDGARLHFRLRPPHAPAIRVEVTVVVSEAQYRVRE